jgi:hypothetical protein
MSFGIRIIIFCLGVVLFVVIFELVRRKRFREELSIAWFLVGFLLIASSVADKIIDPLAKWVGIGYPPALVFVWIIFCLVLALLYFSAVISDLKGKIKELSQKISLLEFELQEQNERRTGGGNTPDRN